MSQDASKPITKLLSKPIQIGDTVSIALETNGRGFQGFFVELLGAFVRGHAEQEALTKVQREADSYLKWLKSPPRPSLKANVVQRHHCKLTVEDGDCEILLEADRAPMLSPEFAQLVDLVEYSGQAFSQLCRNAELRDWVDPVRARGTFYGQTPKTIRETFDHVKKAQYYYLTERDTLTNPSRVMIFSLSETIAWKRLQSPTRRAAAQTHSLSTVRSGLSRRFSGASYGTTGFMARPSSGFSRSK